MIHLRIVSPADRTPAVLSQLEAIEVVTAIVHLPRASRRPDGDVIMCDVPREAGSFVVGVLREQGIVERGSLSIHGIEAAVSDDCVVAQERAPGYGNDAVVWEALDATTSSSAELSFSFLIFMIVSMVLSALSIVTDSVILLIGAMVVGPEFGPLAATCVAVSQRRWDLAKKPLLALTVGFAVGIAVTWLVTLAWIASGIGPATWTPAEHANTLFISRPDASSAIVAALAAVAGMLSLSTANSSALVGVFISVTTIPAAASMAVAIAYRSGEAMGSLLQLAINVGVILAVGVATLLIQRAAFTRRIATIARELRRPQRRAR